MRAIVNVSTGRYARGADRLRAALNGFDGMSLIYRDCWPPGSPSHRECPYAFKAFAIKEAIKRGAGRILWLDASIVPGKLNRLWAHIEEHGYWIQDNGWSTSQWCIDSALEPLGIMREEAKRIPHPVATAFGFDVGCEPAMAAIGEWTKLAIEGKAFRGPWRIPPCLDRLPGPDEVGGHRHDQTALGVVAWRHGLMLTREPLFFGYEGHGNPDTCLTAVGV